MLLLAHCEPDLCPSVRRDCTGRGISKERGQRRSLTRRTRRGGGCSKRAPAWRCDRPATGRSAPPWTIGTNYSWSSGSPCRCRSPRCFLHVRTPLLGILTPLTEATLQVEGWSNDHKPLVACPTSSELCREALLVMMACNGARWLINTSNIHEGNRRHILLQHRREAGGPLWPHDVNMCYYLNT